MRKTPTLALTGVLAVSAALVSAPAAWAVDRPSAPSLCTATAGDSGNYLISWAGPADDGGGTIHHYKLRLVGTKGPEHGLVVVAGDRAKHSGGSYTWTEGTAGAKTDPPTFDVRAVNSAGQGDNCRVQAARGARPATVTHKQTPAPSTHPASGTHEQTPTGKTHWITGIRNRMPVPRTHWTMGIHDQTPPPTDTNPVTGTTTQVATPTVSPSTGTATQTASKQSTATQTTAKQSTATQTTAKQTTATQSTATKGTTLAGSGSATCPFDSSSYWCAPLSKNAPVDPRSGSWIADSEAHAGDPGFNLVDSAEWSQAMYDATCSDPEYHIVPSGGGPTLNVHIPAGAKPAAGADSQLTVDDHCNGIDTDLHHASHSGSTWTAEQTSRYGMSTDGLSESVFDGSSGNLGHRGIPADARGFKLSDVRYAVQHGLPDVGHRVEASWYDTGAGQSAPIWPMSGWEKRHNGGVPEGVVIRIKPGVQPPAGLNAYELVMFHTLQNYGALVGDTGSSNNVIKLQNYVNWSGVGVSSKSLQSVPWSDYQFVKAGYDPTTGGVH